MAFNQNFTSVGLNTNTFAPMGAGAVTISGKLTVPQLTDDGNLGASQVVVTVLQNSTTIYTGPAGAEGFRCSANAALTDTFSVTLSSSASIDQGLNAVKMVFGITSGQ
jgi:hypothetical protein